MYHIRLDFSTPYFKFCRSFADKSVFCIRTARVMGPTPPGTGVIASTIIYGGIMNPAAALLWAGTLDGKLLLAYCLSGLPMDCVQAAATALFLWFAAEPMLEKLDRVKTKYGLLE